MSHDNAIDRRDFLRTSALGAGALSLAPFAPPMGSAFGGLLPDGDNILVIVQLSGGNDGLNTIVPLENDDYHRARPALRQRKNTCIKVADGIGFHGAMKGMKALWDQNELAIVQGVGYPNPNRSHFKSMDIWHSADPSTRAKKSGWLGRLADIANGDKEDPDYTININAQPPLALQGKVYRPISFRDPNSYRFNGSEAEKKAFEKITKAEEGRNAVLDLLGKTAENARKSSDQIRNAARSYRSPVRYPRARGLPQSLRTVAALINAGLSTRVFYVYHGGYDTHANQAGRHQQLLTALSSSLEAFQKDLKRIGKANQVTTMVFSEFGRRVKENGSRGTDHGKAGVSFVVGSKVKGGFYGKQPSLTDLDRGDLNFSTDFRRMYATVLKDWLAADPKKVLGGEFETLPLITG